MGTDATKFSESFSSSSPPSSSSSQSASSSSGPAWVGADTPPAACFCPALPGRRRCRTARRRSRSGPGSSSAWWGLAADRPRLPPGSSGTAYRSDTGRSRDRRHSRRSERSSTSLELEHKHTGRHHGGLLPQCMLGLAFQSLTFGPVEAVCLSVDVSVCLSALMSVGGRPPLSSVTAASSLTDTNTEDPVIIFFL